MRRVSLPEFHAELRAQGVTSPEDYAFRCPCCGTIQSARDLIEAGAGKTFAAVEPYIAFSCIGRWTGAGPHKRGQPPGLGCDWTLGGLLQIHSFEVVDHEGRAHARFEPATPAETQSNAIKSVVAKRAAARQQAAAAP